MSDGSLPVPGWYDDPTAAGQQRFWDGTAWTEHARQPPAARGPVPPSPGGVTTAPAPATAAAPTGSPVPALAAPASPATGGAAPARDLAGAVDAVVRRNYANFSGRASRSEYWWFTLATLLLQLVVQVLVAVLAAVSEVLGLLVGLVGLVVVLGLVVPSLAVGFRRLHDTGRSAWWWLVGLVPVVGPFVLLWFLVQPGEPRRNRWG